ncbi:MAG: hypothetical protein JRM88_03320 [Nitrososphaerota archaeon]|jgi:hypothetical protein|nr:hypothetical protein [Nitrososphaerota archaeon]
MNAILDYKKEIGAGAIAALFGVLILTVVVGAYFPIYAQPSGVYCASPGQTQAIVNGTTETIQTCAYTQVYLDEHGCYNYSNGSSLCVSGAPQGSIARWFQNGTIITTFPNGTKVSCDPSDGTGPCVVGIS